MENLNEIASSKQNVTNNEEVYSPSERLIASAIVGVLLGTIALVSSILLGLSVVTIASSSIFLITGLVMGYLKPFFGIVVLEFISTPFAGP